jgi:preprotein translocase subunit SecY
MTAPISTPQDAAVSSALARRIAVTVAALALYYIGTLVPLPGIEPAALKSFAASTGGPFSLELISIFALGAGPVLSGLILAEMLQLLVPSKRRRAMGRETSSAFNAGIVVAALAFAVYQSSEMAGALERISGFVHEPSSTFRLACFATLTGATALLIVLADMVTRHGLGSGIWLLLVAPALMHAPSTAAAVLDLVRVGRAAPLDLAALIAYPVAATAGLVAFERANPGTATSGAFVWPLVLANAAVAFLLLAAFPFLAPEQMQSAAQALSPGEPLRLVLIALLVPAFAVWRPRSIAGAVPEAARIETPMTLAALLAGIAIAGEVIGDWTGWPSLLDGQTIVILTSIALGILASGVLR